jgi:hypothetical protein
MTRQRDLQEIVAFCKKFRLKPIGKTAKYGGLERPFEAVQLHIQIPKGYKNDAFDVFVKTANRELGAKNVIVSDKF